MPELEAPVPVASAILTITEVAVAEQDQDPSEMETGQGSGLTDGPKAVLGEEEQAVRLPQFLHMFNMAAEAGAALLPQVTFLSEEADLRMAAPEVEVVVA
jgi:hypothetical protein